MSNSAQTEDSIWKVLIAFRVFRQTHPALTPVPIIRQFSHQLHWKSQLLHYGFIRMQSSSTFNTFMFSGCFFNKNRAVVSSGTVRRAAEKSAPLCACWEKQDGRLCEGRCLQRRMLLWHRGAKITRRPQWTPSVVKWAFEAAEEVIASRTLRDPNLQISTKSLMRGRWLRPKTVCQKKKSKRKKRRQKKWIADIDNGRVLVWMKGKIFYIESCKVLNQRGR